MVTAPKRLPPLNSLRAFVAAANHLSFSKAAIELNVTPAAVSQQVKQLEDQLGCALFLRTSRELRLTEEGLACLPGLKEAFARMSEALAQIARIGDRGQLTVSLAPSFAAKWLVPRLEGFSARYPEIDVLVSASMHLVDFESEAVDCAVRYGRGNYPGLHVEKLMEESVVPVCSPELLGKRRRAPAPGDLGQFTLLHDESPDQDPSCPSWRMWLAAAGVEGVDVARGPRFNQSSLVIEAAVAGRGIALAKQRLAAEDIKARRLVALYGGAQRVEFAYYLVMPPAKAALKRVSVFREWLFAEARRDDHA